MTGSQNMQGPNNGRHELGPWLHKRTMEQSLYRDTWEFMHYPTPWKTYKRASPHPKPWFVNILFQKKYPF